MSVSFNCFLTSYEGCDNYLLNKISNFCLSPLVTAFGRTITLYPSNKDPTYLKFTEFKTYHLAIRLLGALSAFILLPMTLVGILIRKCSDSPFHHMQAANEKRVLAKVNDKLIKTKELLDSNKFFGSIKENPSHAIDETIQKDLKLTLDDLLILATCLHDLIRLENPNVDHYVAFYSEKIGQLKPIITESILQAKNCLLFPDDGTRFKKKVEEQLTLLKRSLRLMLFNRSKFNENITEDLKVYHSDIRKNYYDLFIGRHFVYNNLYKKKEVSAFKIIPQKIFGSLTENELNARYEEMQKMFDYHLITSHLTNCHLTNLLSIKWFHKTNSSTLVNIVQSKGKLKSINRLNKKNQLIFHYKKDENFPKLPATISFVANSCLDQMIPHLQELELDLIHCQNPKGMIENDYVKLFTDWTEGLAKSTDFSDFYQKNFDDCSLWDRHRCLKILRMLNEPLFEDALLPKIKAFNQYLENSKEKLDKGASDCHKQFEHLQEVIKSIINLKNDSYDVDDRNFLCKDDYPIVFGMTQPYNANSSMNYEAQYSLKWGKDIKFLFLPPEKIEQTNNYFELKKFSNAEKVKVYSLYLLKVMPHLQRFITHKQKPKDLDKAPNLKIKKEIFR
jgi:hypothetical protein